MNSQDQMAISAALLSWRRPENLPQIVRELRKNPLIKEVLVWNNNPQIALKSDEAIIINSAHNFLPLARYCLVPLTKHPLIWFQDDDLLISAEKLDAIAYGECDIILGQSMLFHKKLFYEVAPTFHALGSIERGDDIAFSLLCRRKHFAVNVEPLVDLGEHDEHALWRQPGHFSVRQHIVDRLLEAMQWQSGERPGSTAGTENGR
jgi:hypothetical protein